MRKNMQALLKELAQTRSDVVDLAALARKHNVSLQHLGKWASKPNGVRILEAMTCLSHQRTRLLLAGAGARAARRLLRLALMSEESETARKACVDLLKIAGESHTTAIAQSASDGKVCVAHSPDSRTDLECMLDELGQRSLGFVTDPHQPLGRDSHEQSLDDEHPQRKFDRSGAQAQDADE